MGEPITFTEKCIHRARPWSDKLWEPYALACIPQLPWGARVSGGTVPTLALLLSLSSATRDATSSAFQCKQLMPSGT